MDRHGRPLPWYTYPMIDLLSAKDFRGRTVLEFGAGYSTLWWASRADFVLSFEGDKAWYERLRPLVPPNVTLILVSEDLRGADKYIGTKHFDVVIIDGLDRLKAAYLAKAVVKDGGRLSSMIQRVSGVLRGSIPFLTSFAVKASCASIFMAMHSE